MHATVDVGLPQLAILCLRATLLGYQALKARSMTPASALLTCQAQA